jgi:hypothetical protein
MVVIQMPKKQFNQAKATFTECQKIFPGYENAVGLVLENAVTVNNFIRESFDDLEEWELSRLNEIRRDINIYKSRIKFISAKMGRCDETLKNLNKYLRCKTRNKEEDNLRFTGWVAIFSECLSLRQDFSVAIRDAERKWSLIESSIMNSHS